MMLLGKTTEPPQCMYASPIVYQVLDYLNRVPGYDECPCSYYSVPGSSYRVPGIVYQRYIRDKVELGLKQQLKTKTSPAEKTSRFFSLTTHSPC